MTDGPSVSEGKEQVESNLKPGAIGGASVAAGNLLLGGTLGPIAGGVVGGTFVDGSAGDNITQTGFMLAGNNLGNGMGGASAGASSNSGGIK